MFNLFTLTSQVLANAHQLTDEASWRAFLKEIVLLARTRATETKTQLDDALVNSVLFVLNSNVLFGYVYRLIGEQCQTKEVLLESVNEDTVAGLVGDAIAKNPEIVDPVVIVSLISQIVSIINVIKTIRNR